ncbi:MAG: hypothetical protein GY913_02340 [Proteobacteria bacterium]|nr:hypothetical protein [Pseudomonadota bacterium]MCP4915739.1 hypothetical protein [Pseudomonadota bacterium]
MLWLVGAAAATELTMAEVARHDVAEDCWMVVDDTVYDVTVWIPAHPGGDHILRGCGKDATWFFEHRDEAGGHSQAAVATLKSFRIGALGEDAAELGPLTVPHPHDVRLARTRLGLTPTADVGPKKSIALRVGHNISTSSVLDSGISFSLGYSFGRLELVVSDEQAAGIGGLEVKVLALDQNRGRPLSIGVVGGSGMAYSADHASLWAQLVLQRELLDRRLALRVNATGAPAMDIGQADHLSTGASVEFRPMPVHGLFGEVQVPLADPSAVAWTGGLSFYTQRHTFALFASSTPSLHPAVLAGPTTPQIAIGASMERAFQLGGGGR